MSTWEQTFDTLFISVVLLLVVSSYIESFSSLSRPMSDAGCNFPLLCILVSFRQIINSICLEQPAGRELLSFVPFINKTPRYNRARSDIDQID